MKVIALALLATFLAATSSSAQDWAKARLEKSPRLLEWVTVKNGERDVK
jgi:carboxymethylenebutenolidase